jgi:ABC-2 type transport system ATP-binding protein
VSAAATFEKVCKVYGGGWLAGPGIRAVQEVSFAVRPGEVFALLGPNRAGKTTLVKILLGLCRATSGTIYRLGRPITDRSTLAGVGYMHENHAFPRYLTAVELMHLYGSLALVPADVLARRVPQLLDRVGLGDRSRESIARFSKGMVQRLGLAQALVNDPELLVLDEPSEGLDLAGRKLLREIVAEMRDRGRSVLLVSHVLSEVEQLCDRVAVLSAGQLVHLGPLAGLIHDQKSGTRRTLETALQELYESQVP